MVKITQVMVEVLEQVLAVSTAANQEMPAVVTMVGLEDIRAQIMLEEALKIMDQV